MNDRRDNSIIAYCAWAKNEEELSMSASGGVFFCMAIKVIKEDGYVVGAVYNEDYKAVQHIITNDIEDVKRMRGSKYSQSNYGYLIEQIEEKCNNGYSVLFSGTPCQCFAVKNRIKSERLICVDLICNGMLDRRILKSEINRLELMSSANISFYTMRYKKNKKQLPIYMRAEFENGSCCEEELYKSALGKVYGARLALQKSCYSCRFKGILRVGDITIGDYRGFHLLNNNTDVNPHGSSTIIVNTEAGNKFLQSIKNDLFLCQAKSILAVIWSNNRIVISGYKPSDKDIKLFWDIFIKDGIEKATALSDKYLSRKGDIKRRVIDRMLLVKYIILNRI